MTALSNRYDFVFLFDVSNGNPNGDPTGSDESNTSARSRPPISTARLSFETMRDERAVRARTTSAPWNRRLSALGVRP
jgi:CRISPR/Cas system type I-B associated protein Csh2 (Cas7 group RAMP superfamily)